MNQNLACNLTSTARRHGQSPVLRLGDTALSYAELDDATARVAGLLRERGVQPGDRVGIMLPNVPQFAVAYYGVLRAGGVVVPMNVLLKEREVAFYLGDSEAKIVFAWREFGEAAQQGAAQAGAECVVVAPDEFERLLADTEPAAEVADRAGDDTAVILYTSGTTGKPKGAELTHASLARNVEVMIRVFSVGPDDVILGALPLFHSFGQTCGLNAAVTSGANQPGRERKPGSIGTPIEGVEMRVVDDQRQEVAQGDVGEIAIRGHNVMKGYWNRPEATAEAIDEHGWFYTGDMARVDDDGCFFIVDRKKELIIRGGYNVYPREIEEVLYEHPAVREAAVIGIPHTELGEEVAAAVALKPDAQISAAELRDFVKDRVAGYKYPRHVWFVDELPKGPTGKILKRAIEAPAQVAGAAEGGRS